MASPNPIVVISPQYCRPHQVDLYTAKRVKKITEGRYIGVFDLNGNNIFKVQTNGFFNCRLTLVDDTGVPVLSLKPVIFSALDEWKVYRGDSTESKDLLFRVKRSNFLQLRTKLDVLLASNTDEYACDFKVKQNFSHKSCIIYRGNSDNVIAEMHKNKSTIRDKLFGKQTFSVTVYPNIDYAFVIAVGVVLNEVNHTHRSAGGGGGD
ncbi:hypothetical protein MKW92_024035 [Papaver armeniacum]|nr:hypothetical protein MKW92_024035 [Papaver armeniacum]